MWEGLAHYCDCHSFHTSDLPHMFHLSCPFLEWSPSYCIQIALSLPLSCFPKVHTLACAKNLSDHLYLVLTGSLIHNIITFTRPCHASYVRWMSPGQGRLANGPILTSRGEKNSQASLDPHVVIQFRLETGSRGPPSDEGICTIVEV